MSITEDAPVEAPPQPRPEAPRAAAWWWVVAASVLVLVATAATLAVWWGLTRETRTTTYRVLGDDLAGVRLDLGDADVEIDGGAPAVEVRRVDRFAFGEPSREERSVIDGRLSIVSRCPDQVLGSCHATYRLTVPDNVPVEIETSSGSVLLTGVRASVQVDTPLGRDHRDRLLRLLAARELRLRRRQRRGGVLGRPARAALAQRRRARGGAGRALPGRRAERFRVHSHPRVDAERRRAVPDPGAERERRRQRRGLVVTGNALDLSPHLRAARRALLYLIVGLGQGLTYLLVIGGGLVLGTLLAPLWVGLPLLAGDHAAGVAARRGRAPPGQPVAGDAPAADAAPRAARRAACATNSAAARCGACWRCWCSSCRSRSPAWRSRSLRCCSRWRSWSSASAGVTGEDGRLFGPFALGPAVGLALCLLSLPATIVSIAALEGVGSGLRALAVRLLRSRVAEGGPVRELLAERLGDRSLTIAYWLPEREIFVDDAGRPVVLPDPGSGRAWTAVEREGVRVAAIVHDAELDASPELVTAAASAAALAIDNERLKAELRARVEELRVSRLRIVEAADDARRRIERDLHDGAQQQLVSLALDLRMLKVRLADSGLAGTVDQIGEKLAVALAELREFARGIHPAFLSERGVGAAVEALVARAPLDVDADVSLDGRLPAPVEAAAYFVIAEGLTNVVRYAETRNATVQVSRRGGEVVVVVADDGKGGATVAGGTGLRGLIDRLAVLDGHLEVSSPVGGGTRLEAHIPIESGSIVAEAART